MNRHLTKMQYFLEFIRPYRLPLFLLLLVIGRMILFGDARIPIGMLFQKYIFPVLR